MGMTKGRHRNYMALYRPVLVLYGVLPGLYGDDIVLKKTWGLHREKRAGVLLGGYIG